jgi:hypothetical protein
MNKILGIMTKLQTNDLTVKAISQEKEIKNMFRQGVFHANYQTGSDD